MSRDKNFENTSDTASTASLSTVDSINFNENLESFLNESLQITQILENYNPQETFNFYKAFLYENNQNIPYQLKTKAENLILQIEENIAQSNTSLNHPQADLVYRAYKCLGILYIACENYNKASAYFERVVQYAPKLNKAEDIAIFSSFVSSLGAHKGDNKKSYEYCALAVEFGDELPLIESINNNIRFAKIIKVLDYTHDSAMILEKLNIIRDKLEYMMQDTPYFVTEDQAIQFNTVIEKGLPVKLEILNQLIDHFGDELRNDFGHKGYTL